MLLIQIPGLALLVYFYLEYAAGGCLPGNQHKAVEVEVVKIEAVVVLKLLRTSPFARTINLGANFDCAGFPASVICNVCLLRSPKEAKFTAVPVFH